MTPQAQVQLAPYTTFGIGGDTSWFCDCSSESEIESAITFAKEKQLPVFILGGGSNVLVSDAGFDGVTIKNSIVGIEVISETDTDVLIEVGAGEVFDELVAWSVGQGYWGLENLSHIPGSVGATPIQNVGAYGVEIDSVVESVRTFNSSTGVWKTFSKKDCQFGYRDSFFKSPVGREYVVVSVTFRLRKDPTRILSYRDLAERFSDSEPTQTEIREAVIEIRSAKFPDWHTIGTAGSFFKNPIIPTKHYMSLRERYPELPGFVVSDTETKVPLGWILDKICGVRGRQVGPVGSYQGQALVIINTGGATAAAVSAFAEDIASQVKEKTEIEIEWEVTKVGSNQS